MDGTGEGGAGIEGETLMTEAEKRYRQKNKKKISQHISAWRKAKKASDPEYRAKQNAYHKQKHIEYRQDPEVKERERIKSNDYNVAHREERAELSRTLYHERYAVVVADRLATLRNIILDHYGRKCSCSGCGETIDGFLSLDHVGGWRAVHPERKTRMAPLSFYRWIVENNFPDTIRVRCMNCNWGTRNGNMCPHEAEIDRAMSDLLSRVEVGGEVVIANG